MSISRKSFTFIAIKNDNLEKNENHETLNNEQISEMQKNDNLEMINDDFILFTSVAQIYDRCFRSRLNDKHTFAIYFRKE